MPARRLAFIDGLRGIAIILMVLNHTSRDWLDPSLGWSRYYLIYGSLLLPAPIFLFLVGFCLPLSFRNAASPDPGGAALRYLRRGLFVIAGGLVLNLLVNPDKPVWTGGVLQTIGLSIILIGPAMPLLARPWARHALLVLAVLLYGLFASSHAALREWSVAHPVLGQILFTEFPPWPWTAAAFVGFVLGWWWLDARARSERAELRYFQSAAILGAVFVAAYHLVTWLGPARPPGFKADLIVNGYWTPGGTTLLLVVGGVASLLAGCYWLMEVRPRPCRWLVVLGQTALMLYFVHQVIEFNLVRQFLGVHLQSWTIYWAATLAFMVSLVYLGRAWLELRRLARASPWLPAALTGRPRLRG